MFNTNTGLRLLPAAVLLGATALVGACGSPTTTTRTTSSEQTTSQQPAPVMPQSTTTTTTKTQEIQP
jgi:heme-binding NEAT domain protein